MRKSKYIDIRTREGRQQFYQTKEWRALRYLVLTFQPYCQECLLKGITTLGNEVDHIIDVKDAPERFMDITNLQVLCKPCHSLKTIQHNMSTVHPVYTVKNKKWDF